MESTAEGQVVLKRRILKGPKETILPIEEQMAQAMQDLEAGSAEWRTDLRELVFHNATEMDIGGGRRAILLVVPYRLLAKYHRVHTRLVRELEKKFSGRQVVIIGKRRILPKERHGRRLLKQKRPRSRTLTAVHEAYLEDVVYPTDIIGKRVLYRTDQSRLMRVHLDPRERPQVEHRIDTYAVVYKKLTGKDVVFEFPDA
ncbi:40S ribosomal protein [Cyanidiococcus yangmingshanensis]|uniref:40S ribosomal protein S7 n=1 Tax=Cyanidiococcus yangmingshanensis TaxID=2690220 RepID=A0A7J7IBS8_9RHOD|nr:40S ribosomal protein [Cyanidiococcus yangmingshanensis]